MSRTLHFPFQKPSIMKKTMELSVLCYAAACAVVVDADGEVSTWAENHCEVLNIIIRYKDWRGTHDEKKAFLVQRSDDSFFETLSMDPVQELLKDCAGEDNNDQNLLEQVNSKLHAVKKRIEFLKSAADSTETPCLSEYSPEQSLQQMVATPCFSEKETVGSIQTSWSLEYASNEEQIIPDMVTGFTEDVEEKSFVGLLPDQFVEENSEKKLPQFAGDNSEQSIFENGSRAAFLSEQFDPPLNLTNSEPHFFFF